uniref:Gustatory receptor n=2 Tax=Schizaphis graminum TaxID=13262 RepID=A0A2S2NXN3_SCHGA
MINGIIEFDRKVDGLPLTLLGELTYSTTKYSWNKFLAVVLVSYISLQIFSMWLWPPARFDFSIVVKYFFEMPCIMEFVIFSTSYFYLHNLGSRFEMLNSLCKRLLDGHFTTTDTWTQSEITQFIENIRLLHAELCDLLRTFSSGYGVVLLFYFVFNFLGLLRCLYYLLHMSRYLSSNNSVYFSALNISLIAMICSQNVIFVLILLIAISWLNRKKIEIVSFLRSIHISKLPFGTKLQIKMFMNQLSTYEWDQITAYGIFPMDLRIVLSFLLLLTTTLATSLQMKEHPYMVKFNNVYHSYLKFEYLNLHE